MKNELPIYTNANIPPARRSFPWTKLEVGQALFMAAETPLNKRTAQAAFHASIRNARRRGTVGKNFRIRTAIVKVGPNNQGAGVMCWRAEDAA